LKIIIILIVSMVFISCGENTTKNKIESVCNLKLNPKLTAKIIAGEDCINDSSPIVKLTLFDDEGRPSYCSAVVIDKTLLLTAAHCFEDFIISGEALINNQQIPLKNVEIHPSLFNNGERIEHDLAIITLDQAVAITPIKINFETKISVGDTLYIYGFGRASATDLSDSTTGTLREGKMPLEQVDDQFIYSTYTESSSNPCTGDSGGPAFILTDKGLELVGITSTGSTKNCTLGDQTAFTRLNNPINKQFLEQFVN
jgi:V8-like Glu-specific endopeptidase